MAEQYANQTEDGKPLSPSKYEICFIINYPEHPDSLVNKSYQDRFEKSIEVLLEKKREHPNIHILPKVFGTNQGSLGRARKYGLDYCLWRCLEQPPESLDKIVIISNEGDTLSIPADYIARFIRLFGYLLLGLYFMAMLLLAGSCLDGRTCGRLPFSALRIGLRYLAPAGRIDKNQGGAYYFFEVGIFTPNYL